MIDLIGLDYFRNRFLGIVERKEKYIVFYLLDDGTIERGAKYLKRYYRDYDHFAEVLQQFHPYISLFREPIQVKDLNYETLLEAWQRVSVKRELL